MVVSSAILAPFFVLLFLHFFGLDSGEFLLKLGLLFFPLLSILPKFALIHGFILTHTAMIQHKLFTCVTPRTQRLVVKVVFKRPSSNPADFNTSHKPIKYKYKINYIYTHI